MAVRDPLAAWLRPGPCAPADAVASRLAAALLPREAPDPPPRWLRPDQHLSFRRGLAAARGHGGTLIADGVGTGKTFISLAVAQTLEPGRTIHLIVPAALREQWLRAAGQTSSRVRLHTHETLSRGRRPGDERGPVIVDESHRFRTPSTRRYHALAAWCIGRHGILLSATPAVNRLEDLEHQLRLFAPDALDRLGELVVTGEDRSGALPGRRERTIAAGASPGVLSIVRRLGGLVFSRDPAVAELLRVTCLRAAASSPAAVASVLSRYHALLRHAADAAACGRHLTREVIRQFVGADDRQLVLWPLVAESSDSVDLAPDDLVRLPSLLADAEAAARARDPKAAALAAVLADRRPTMVFTGSIPTLGYLRRRLPRRGVAWLSGQGAGLDAMAAERETVLDWFRRASLPGDDRVSRPRILLATDVAAEGLDLPLLERIVHYDLPWTAVRLEQRAGRALRLGSRHETVEIVRFVPPGALARTLRQERILDCKARLPARLGIDPAPDAVWRLRARLAAAWRGVPRAEGCARVRGSERAVVAGVRIELSDGGWRELVLVRRGRRWTGDLGTIARCLEAARDPVPMALDGMRARAALAGLSRHVSAALRLAHGAALGPSHRTGAVRRLLHRIRTLSTRAARRRDPARLALLARGMRHLRRHHTAGEAARLTGWAALPDADLLTALERLPPESAAPAPVRVALIGLLVVEGPR